MTNQVRSQSGRRVAGVLLLVMLVTASCGGDPLSGDVGAAVVEPTLGHTGTEDADGVTTEAVSNSGPPAPATDAFTPPGPPLEPLASAEEITEAIEEAHGPTDDVAGHMNRFIDFPDVPTPDGAVITGLRADVRSAVDPEMLSATAEVTFTAEGTTTDLAEFYAGELGDIVMVMHPASSDDEPRAEVRLRHMTLVPADDLTPRERLEGWAAGAPLPTGGAVTGAAIQTTTFKRDSLFFSLSLRYPGADSEDLAAEVRDQLPAGGYALDPQPEYGDRLDNWVYLSNPQFAEALVSTHQPLVDGVLSETTTIKLDARTEFAPTRS